MLFRKLTLVFCLFLILFLSGCTSKGSIVIVESLDGTSFTIKLNQYNKSNKCELFLNSNDEVQIEVLLESGTIALTVNGKKGSKPYTGKNLQINIFTISVSEKDDYVFKINGQEATGKIIVKNLRAK